MAELQGAIGALQPGQNGRLFLGQQDGFHLDLFTSGDPYNEPFLHRWRRTLQRRAAELASRGIPYVFFIVPDTPSVYPEDLPPELQSNFTPPGQLFLDAMQGVENVHFVYPLAALKQAKGGLDIYQKKDSHWTTYGSYLGYRELMRTVETLVPCTIIPARDVSFTFRRSYGDLGCLTDPEQHEEVPVPHITGAELETVLSFDGALRQTATESRAPAAASCRAMFFRDSFMTDLAPYIARSFSDVVTMGSTTRVMLDAVDRWKPSIVVSQVAERKLFFLQSDHLLETHDTIYRAGFRTQEGARLLQALNMTAEDPQGALRFIEPDIARLAEDPENAYFLALIHESAGQPEVAHDLAVRAVQARPEHPSFLALAARTALGKGDLPAACGYAARSAEAAPYSAYYAELAAYCFVISQKPDEALRILDPALERIKDSANLWYWGGVCKHAMGDIATASRRAREAYDLDPQNGDYERLLAGLQAA